MFKQKIIISLILIFLLGGVLLVSAQTKYDGEKVFKSLSCLSCHSYEKGGTTPSVKAIQEAYNEAERLFNFLVGKENGKMFPDKENTIMASMVIPKLKKMEEAKVRAMADYLSKPEKEK